MFSKRILTSGFVLLFGSLSLFAQGPYAPAAGQVGSSAIDVNSNQFVLWASGVELTLGWQNIADTSLGHAAVGTFQSAIGKPGDGDVVSLGDGGSATFTFLGEIYNGPGADFAIFENSFSDDYLELAHIEVSSDGINFFRFPSTSLLDTTTQIGPFGTMDCTYINNLAGKYRGGFGTPFDLEELQNIPGLDIDLITHVRVIDVVGSIDNQFGTRDASGRLINDPWPTDFASSGFDLDGLGIIHSTLIPATVNQLSNAELVVFPNPAVDYFTLKIGINQAFSVEILNALGNRVMAEKAVGTMQLNVSDLPQGFYYVVIQHAENQYSRTLVKQ